MLCRFTPTVGSNPTVTARQRLRFSLPWQRGTEPLCCARRSSNTIRPRVCDREARWSPCGAVPLLSSVDRHIGARHARSQLASLGVRESTVLQIEGLRVALPLSVVIVVSGAIGALVCNNMLDLTTPYPTAGLAWTIAAAGAFLSCSVAFVCAMSRRGYFGVAD